MGELVWERVEDEGSAAEYRRALGGWDWRRAVGVDAFGLPYQRVPEVGVFCGILSRLSELGLHSESAELYREAVAAGRLAGKGAHQIFFESSRGIWRGLIDWWRRTYPGAEDLTLFYLRSSRWERFCRSMSKGDGKGKARSRSKSPAKEVEVERTESRVEECVEDVGRLFAELDVRVKARGVEGVSWGEVMDWVANHVLAAVGEISADSVPDVRCVGLLRQAQEKPEWFWKLKSDSETRKKVGGKEADEVEGELRRVDEVATRALMDEFSGSLGMG